MARPKKTNCDYFPHDNGMRNNKKIKALRAKFGLEGFAIWSMLLEYLTSCDFLEFEYNALEMELLAGDFGTSSETLERVLRYCLEIGLLQTEAGGLAIGSVVNCVELSRRLQSVFDKRGRVSAAGTRVSGAETPQDVDFVGFQTSKTPKLKERKGKEMKENEMKLNQINPFPESVDFALAWEEWEQYRKERRAKITPTTAKHQAAFLSKFTEREAVAIIRQSITNGWQGLFEIKKQNNGKPTLKDSAGIIDSYFESGHSQGA